MEVLIVVVIIGVLAALVMPRILGSPEKAKMAEAYQMIGALSRAQQNYMDLNGTTTPSNFICPVPPSTCTLPSSLGMKDIIQKNFRYVCATDSAPELHCYALRMSVPEPNEPYILRAYTGAQAGLWRCYRGYVTADGGVEGASDKGCKPNW
ncbi:MAG: hypothetical protein V1882_08570 [Candidatus Omnitrophota bacterium]